MVAQTEAALSDLSRVAFEAKELAQDSATATAAAKGYAEQAKKASEAAVIASNAAQQAADNAETAADSAQVEAQQAQIAAEDSANSAAEAAQVSNDSLAIANDAKKIAQNAEQSATTAKDSATAKASEAAASAQAAAASVASIDPATIVRVLAQTFTAQQKEQARKNIGANVTSVNGKTGDITSDQLGCLVTNDGFVPNFAMTPIGKLISQLVPNKEIEEFLLTGDNSTGVFGAMLSLRGHEGSVVDQRGSFLLAPRTPDGKIINDSILIGLNDARLLWQWSNVLTPKLLNFRTSAIGRTRVLFQGDQYGDIQLSEPVNPLSILIIQTKRTAGSLFGVVTIPASYLWGVNCSITTYSGVDIEGIIDPGSPSRLRVVFNSSNRISITSIMEIL